MGLHLNRNVKFVHRALNNLHNQSIQRLSISINLCEDFGTHIHEDLNAYEPGGGVQYTESTSAIEKDSQI